MNWKWTKGLLATSLVVLASACATMDAQNAHTVAQPKTTPVRTLTSFTPALQCMDNLFLAFGVKNVVITSAGIPDATGEVRVGTKDMLIHAVSEMSIKSGAFAFVDLDHTQIDVERQFELAGFTEEFRLASYYIRGAITQLDSGVIANQVGGGISIADAQIGVSKDMVASVVSIDMSMGKLVTRQIMPGISANNSIAVSRSGIGGDAGATIGKAGVFFNISLNKSEGMHAATRTLVELNTIEILGKLTEVPYWRCLSIEQTHPEVLEEARSWFDGMSEAEQVTFVQRALQSEGHYDAAITGVFDDSTKAAVARYQAENDLIASGRIDFQLYQSLIHEDLSLGVRPLPVEPPSVEASAPVPFTLSLNTPKGPAPTYAVNETLEMNLSATQDAYVYCYYRDDEAQIARIFPNRFNPDPYVIAGRPVSVLAKGAPFAIAFEAADAREEILCVASRTERGLQVSDALKTPDLTPIPVASLEEVAASFKRAGRDELAEARLPISVVAAN